LCDPIKDMLTGVGKGVATKQNTSILVQ